MTLPLIRGVLETESNAATFAALLVYGFAAWLLAYGLSNFSIGGWGAGALLLAAFAAALAYNYHVFSVVEERRR